MSVVVRDREEHVMKTLMHCAVYAALASLFVGVNLIVAQHRLRITHVIDS